MADSLEMSDLASWQTIAEGDPVEEILNYARTADADLIAMTTESSAAMAVAERADRAVLFQKVGVPAHSPKAWKLQ